jgi:hypothetical protein
MPHNRGFQPRLRVEAVIDGDRSTHAVRSGGPLLGVKLGGMSARRSEERRQRGGKD